MKAFKLLFILTFIVIGIINRRHVKPHHEAPQRVDRVPAQVNREILQNAEHLTETLRRCQQTAEKKNKPI